MATYSRRSSRIQPTERSSAESITNKTRSFTDGIWLIFFTIFLIGLLCFLGYCVFYGDIFRTLNGYDNCGYVCGKPNNFPGSQRSNQDCRDYNKIEERYHIMVTNDGSKEIDKLCVSDCSKYNGYKPVFNRCIQNRTGKVVNNLFSRTGLKNFFSEVSEDFQLCWQEMCYLCLISLGCSLTILVLFRYVIGVVVWVVLLGSIAASITGTVILWTMWRNSKMENDNTTLGLTDIEFRKTNTYFAFAILASIATLVISLIIIVMRKRIKLVVQLFKESGKAVAAMPVLLFQPILTFLCLGAVLFLWCYFSLWIESSGVLVEKRQLVYYYEKDGWMRFARWYNFFGMLWMTQFVIGCQHMVIAGAVSIWYFNRNKSEVRLSAMQSAGNLIRYHLGSIALGSFIVALVQFLRVILKAIEKYLGKRQGKCVNCALKFCQCCLYCFEKILKYLSRNAYIEVAINGYPFCKAGRQAFKLLSSNVLRVAAINSVGDFVLFLGKALVVVATVLIGIKLLQFKDEIHHMWVPVTLSGLFAYFIAHCFISTYEMTIDTIFLCFCEDCEQNDGAEKPYYMSRGLMEFVENSKRTLENSEKRCESQRRTTDIATVSGKIV
ncbi:unnamed protein product [Phaedon cochleariae]|uniref:Choline transporter-like protein n=1 Tax=Phaedon cochleariae TaxID=80249 RepID=A0A9P0DK74_PHACE|nr:unnamed protein product [Phaedon cochleariae]